MKKLLSFVLMLVCVIGLQSCDEDSTITGGIIPEPDLVGCEATTFYDWDSFEFETSLDGGATTWLGFSLDETTLFSINLNQAGFQCVIFDGCAGEYGSPPPIYDFQSNGNGQEVGIVYGGDYYLEITNTRPNRLDFTFRIELADIVYGCMDENALNYDETANVDAGNCELNDCTTQYWVDNYGEMVNDCDGNCAPITWIGDGWCDTGDWGIYDADGNIVGINLWCEEFNWDEGDCEEIIEECSDGLIEDCFGNCAPEDWVGDGYCDDGSFNFNDNDIFFNCEAFNNDEGDCDGSLQRSTQERLYPNSRIPIN